MIKAKIIADSISISGKRLTTLQVKFHRFILPEFNTHRAFSRNFSSSRAIPTKKLLEMVRSNPAIPLHWGKNQPGMQAEEEMVGIEREEAIKNWRLAAQMAANQAEQMAARGVHKQITNRIIEPYLFVNGIVTSTEWDNFFTLRCHPDAQPEIQALANAMRDAMDCSTPRKLMVGDWHLPYITEQERSHDEFGVLAQISAARCCRVSYNNHDGTEPERKKDLKLFTRLAGAVPIHASPLEHQAEASNDSSLRSGNFAGWAQFRSLWEAKLFDNNAN